MPIDPNIPLQAGVNIPQYGPTPQQLLSLQQLQMKMEEARRQMGAQNALRDLFRDPQNLDPKTSMPTPNALNRIMAIDPNTGIELRGQMLKGQEQQARIGAVNSKIAETSIANINDLNGKALNAYDDALKSGMSTEQAKQTGQRIYTEGRSQFVQSGLIAPDMASRIPMNFDPQNARAGALTYQQKQQADRQGWEVTTDYPSGQAPVEYRYNKFTGEARELNADKPYIPSGRPKPDKADEQTYNVKGESGKTYPLAARDPSGIGFIDTATGEKIKERIVGASKTGSEKQRTPQQAVFDKYLEDHPGASSEDMAKFLESQHPARSGPAAAVRKFIEENPNASAADIASFNAWQRETSAGAQAFGTGTQGNLTRAQNVAIDHLRTLGSDLIPALNNGDVRSVNAIKNWAKTEFGYEGPVDFNFAKGIVSQEVNKSIVNVGAGTETERKNLADSLSAANSPEQLAGVIQTAKRLMAGQLRGLEEQYINVTVPPNQQGDPKATERAREVFRHKLAPETQRELSSLPGGGMEAPIPAAAKPQASPPSGSAAEVSEEQYNKLPPGSAYRVPGNPAVMFKP